MKQEFTEKEKAIISTSLSKKLGPEFISYRTGYNNTRLMYVEGWLIITLANQIFGFNGWSSEVKEMIVDYSEKENNKWAVGVTCTARIILKDGTTREDVGFGSAENQRSKGQAIEKARKEAVTDAIKRALRQFGNALGNCCYDKEYAKEIAGVSKVKKTQFDANRLLRKNDNIDNSLDMENLDFD